MKSITAKIIMGLVLLAGSSHAAEPITGAFGFKFGEVLDQSVVIGDPTYSPHGISYQVRPKTPNDAFKSYDVEITPVSRQIHTITANARYANKAEAESVAAELMGILEKKYGGKDRNSKGSLSIHAGDASVSINISGRTPGFFWVEYVNEDIKTRGAGELPDIKSQLIEGGFGLKLGGVPDRSAFTGTNSASGNKSSYGIKPPVPNDLFQTYMVGLTAPEGKIHTIHAVRKFEEAAEAKKAFQNLAGELEKKYGLRDSLSNSETAYFFAKDVNITLLVGVYGSQAKLDLLYTHKELEKLAEKSGDSVKKGDDKNKVAQIDGAFGFKFGEKFDPSTALEKRPVSTGGFIYLVKPPNPNQLFTDYFLVITPKTHAIVGVWANRMFKSKSEALEKQAVLKPILEEKYGKAVGDGSQRDKFVIQHPDESISMSALENSDGEVFVLIKYHSEKLNKKFVQEMQEEAASKADKTGL